MWKTASTLIGIVLVLLSLGIVMLASTSSVKGETDYGDALHFVKRQVLWLGLALAAGIWASFVDYHRWYALAVPLALAAVAGLVLVFVPGVGARVGGCCRWLRVAGFSVQPSEFAKFATVVMLAAWMARMGRRAGRLREGLVLPVLALGLVLGLIFLEPDFGTTILLALVGMAVLFAGGTPPAYLAVTGALGASVMAYAILRDPVRLGRILAFLLPDKHPEVAYHVEQSVKAFILGGLRGAGLSQSIQKHFYLPEAHTDFIFAIVGEELGIATLLVLLLFAGILVCGLRISLAAPDPFGRLLGFGLTVMISLQAMINIGVVTGCLPTKGLTLPFISYGGSSLFMSLLGIGVLINVARHSGAHFRDAHTRLIRDRAHRFD